MTKKLFWQNPYLTELETTIKSLHGDQLTVKETIFYALSGGQESDHGTMNGRKVLEARKEGKEIYYTLADVQGLKVEDPLKMVIDGERRYKLMRLHFAAEVVLELVYQKFLDTLKIGAHISPEKARIDFYWEGSMAPALPGLQQEAQAIIDSNQDIISAFSDEQNERRYWKINEFSQVPCGGTHLKNTSEIGTLSLKRVNPGKGKERIEIYVS